MALKKPWWLPDAGFIAAIVGVATMGVMSVNKPKAPALPFPPGFVAPKTKGPPMQANVAVPIHRNLLLAVAPNVTFTCDIGTGGYDGVNFYEGRQQGNLTLLRQFPPTNVFPVSLDTNWPHFVSVRTFVNWPNPGVIQVFTNGDGTVTQVTNTFYENQVAAEFLWVPAGMTNQWLAISSELGVRSAELIGWGAQGATYTVKRANSLNGPWETLGTIPGTNGPWTVPDDGQAAARFFSTTVTN